MELTIRVNYTCMGALENNAFYLTNMLDSPPQV